MNNSRRSDRELAKSLHVSQPIVGKIIKRLEKEGIIKEYTIIPDFKRLGYPIMDFTLFRLKVQNLEDEIELKRAASKMEQQTTFANMIVARGSGENSPRSSQRLF